MKDKPVEGIRSSSIEEEKVEGPIYDSNPEIWLW